VSPPSTDRRGRRAELTPLVALVGAVALTAVVSYGNQQARLTLDPVLAVAAAVAVHAAVRALATGRSSPETHVPAETGTSG